MDAEPIQYEVAARRLVGLVEEWRNWPLAERREFHQRPVQNQIRW